MQSVLDYDPSETEQVVGLCLAAHVSNVILPEHSDEILVGGPVLVVREIVGLALPVVVGWAVLPPETKKKTVRFVKRHYARLVSWDSAVGFVSSLLPQLALVAAGVCAGFCWSWHAARPPPQGLLQRLGRYFRILFPGGKHHGHELGRLLLRHLSSWTWSTLMYHCIYWQPIAARGDYDAETTHPPGMPASSQALGLAHRRFGMFFDISVGRPVANTLATFVFGGMKSSFIGYFAGSLVVASAATRLEPTIHRYLGALPRRAGEPPSGGTVKEEAVAE